MFVFKYAMKSISRSIGRNILIGIIVFIIATAACVAMSIQQAAQTAAAESLKDMNIAAQVNIDRGYVYQKAQEENNTSDMKELMPAMTSMMKEYAIDLEDMEEYASIKKADSDEPLVKSYYYNASISINGDSIEKYDLTASSSTQETTAADATAPTVVDPQGNVVETPSAPEMAQPEQMEKQGDFSLVGYSSYEAMEDFGSEDDDSICTITDGAMFADNTSDNVCIIEDDLAGFNNVGVGDEIKLVNPRNDKEAYTLKIVGIYNNSSGTSSNGDDAANTIITSYAVVKDIEAQSEKTNPSSGDSDEDSDAMLSQFVGTFIFGSVDDYNQFKEEVKLKAVSEGLDEDLYIVTSSDIAAFKAGLKPLENLKSFATTFLYLMLGIGAIVLIVISVISIRDRKYEIGVLAAMGLKKFKLSMLFMIEVLMITLIAIMAGAAVGSAVSVPVTNSLLSAQVEQQEQSDSSNQPGQQMPGGNMERPDDGEYDKDSVVYVKSVGFSVDIFVILKMLAIGIGLAVVSGFTSIFFILRYDPKQILANRD